MLNTSHIYENQSHQPQNNFSGTDLKNNPESEFGLKFSHSYSSQFVKIQSGTNKKKTLFIREVPISGNGIADLLVFCWNQDATSLDRQDLNFEQVKPTIRAFEFKMSDWRKGMMQAHRYKYFSHASILVLPKQKLKSAISQIEVFKKLRVGLWGFDSETGFINCAYTPRPKQQFIPKYGNLAIQLATQAIYS